MKRLFAAALFAFAACQTPGPASLAEMEGASNWNLDDGDALAYRFERDMRRLLVGRDVGDALGDLRNAGYECPGEAGPVCAKAFATRSCQLDWRVVLFPKGPVVEFVNTEFWRDCVGKDRDWPEPKASAIDDQLAPAKP